ncbi:MAG: ATP synthase F1 subunit epsilon [Candidatus Levybacteria bacterium CG10_big_fil_rev_8_21_14_0_10_35_13]|nr:MAG: ATP synthase F1 subunit epsilon [Candidatus Levybacteria bacterium CG10_big_fil_rev_8_21_14_0_10_35_13]
MIKLALEVITPTKVVLSEEADVITVTTTKGEISILPGHVDLLTKLLPGEMVIKNGSKTDYFAITGGFLEVSKNKVNILADYAVRASDIEIAKAREAQERAEKTMKEKQENKEFIVAQAELRKALLELKVAAKHKIRNQ